MEGGGGGGRQSDVGGRGNSNKAGTTEGFRVTKLSLGTDPNAPLAHDPGLELHHPILNKLGDPGG